MSIRFRSLVIAGATMMYTPQGLAEFCGVRSCLVAQPLRDGGYTVHIVSKTTQPMVCYIRWENFFYVERLTTRTKDYKLNRGYPISGVSWRCDPATECSLWMSNAGLCKGKTGNPLN